MRKNKNSKRNDFFHYEFRILAQFWGHLRIFFLRDIKILFYMSRGTLSGRMFSVERNKFSQILSFGTWQKNFGPLLGKFRQACHFTSPEAIFEDT